MANRQNGGPALAQPARLADPHHAFNEGELWIGRHSADQDILVFDPAEVDSRAERISLYSLSQHRLRTFPRTVIRQHIQPLTDELPLARARKDYAGRAELVLAHERSQAELRAERAESLRNDVLEAHRRYLDALGIPHAGILETPGEGRRGRRTKCHACGISLDNFVGAVCAVCNGVLCSCGTCGCGSPGPRK